jgi:hypothetical protein
MWGSRALSWTRTVAVATALAIAGILGANTTASAVVGPAADPCGYWEGGPSAFYTHCTSDGSHIIVRVERERGLSGYDQCVYPGRNYLGHASIIKFAWYTGRLC